MVSVFQIGIFQNAKCDNLFSFPKSGHIAIQLIHAYLPNSAIMTTSGCFTGKHIVSGYNYITW